VGNGIIDVNMTIIFLCIFNIVIGFYNKLCMYKSNMGAYSKWFKNLIKLLMHSFYGNIWCNGNSIFMSQKYCIIFL